MREDPAPVATGLLCLTQKIAGHGLYLAGIAIQVRGGFVDLQQLQSVDNVV
jgi:hypothetical protein